MKLLLALCFAFKVTTVFAQVDVVFDLDWTLIYAGDKSMADDPRTVFIEGKYYRIADGAEEIIADLVKKPDFRVSFFSGGEKVRNHKLLKSLFLPGTNKSFYEAAYKILNKEDLAIHSSDPEATFTDRYKKDLRLVNENLDNVVLIDDLKSFTPAGQKKNVFWLGKTYAYAETFAQAPYGAFAPPSEIAWLHERKKLFWTHNALESALEESKRTGKSFIESLRLHVKKENPAFPTMKNIRVAGTTAFKLTGKPLINGHAASFLECASFFFK